MSSHKKTINDFFKPRDRKVSKRTADEISGPVLSVEAVKRRASPAPNGDTSIRLPFSPKKRAFGDDIDATTRDASNPPISSPPSSALSSVPTNFSKPSLSESSSLSPDSKSTKPGLDGSADTIRVQQAPAGSSIYLNGTTNEVSLTQSASSFAFPSSATNASGKTQPQTPSPTKRSFSSSLITLKNGIKGVRSSDDEENEEEEELSGEASSEEDIAAIIAKRRATIAAKPLSIDISKPERTDTPRRGMKATPKVKAGGKFSLDALIARSVKEQEAESIYQKMKADLQAQAEREQLCKEDLREDDIAAVLNDDEESGDAQRLLQAMKRTDAFQRDMVYNFFIHSKDPVSPAGKPFPKEAVADHGWAVCLSSRGERNHAFLSGFVKTMLVYESLPQAVLSWLVEEVYTEKRVDLVHAYIETLQASKSELSAIFVLDVIKDDFMSMGASMEAVDIDLAVSVTRKREGSDDYLLPSGIRPFVKLLRSVGSCFYPKVFELTLGILMRLIVDHRVQEDSNLLFEVEDCIEHLLQTYEDAPFDKLIESLAGTAYRTILLPLLRQRLVHSLPCRTRKAHRFRRKLALAFALDDASGLRHDYDFNNPKNGLFESIVCRIRDGSEFLINSNTDYGALGALVYLIDVVIDSGLPIDEQLSKRQAEAQYNSNVDQLVDHLKRLFNSIADTGLAHMKRTEAKSALEILMYRLEHAVRTKPKPKKDIFDLSKGDADIMNKYFIKADAEGVSG